jgi:hypothetical protein
MTIRTTKSRDIIKPDQILHRPEEPKVEKLEHWAAGDGGSSATNLQEAFDL